MGRPPVAWLKMVPSCPIELSALLGTFYTCAVCYSGHWPYVAVNHLKCSWCNGESEFLMLI